MNEIIREIEKEQLKEKNQVLTRLFLLHIPLNFPFLRNCKSGVCHQTPPHKPTISSVLLP